MGFGNADYWRERAKAGDVLTQRDPDGRTKYRLNAQSCRDYAIRTASGTTGNGGDLRGLDGEYLPEVRKLRSMLKLATGEGAFVPLDRCAEYARDHGLDMHRVTHEAGIRLEPVETAGDFLS